jgi:3-hydroxyacyl-CoA dehydrogenase/enoyl-CoA hydratase/3-hydroxybutyryl-CoA epimerase
MTNAELTETKKQVLLRKRSNGVAFFMLDGATKHNILNSNVFDEFEETLKAAQRDPEVLALVIVSAKPDTFCAGADLQEITKFSTEEEALALSTKGQALFNQIADLGKPVVAAINGVCLGGGLEMALCCTRRIATDVPETILGLPEVKLGFVPGLGGTQRLPRIAGLKGALEVILSAEPITAQRAKELGIVDLLVHPDDLLKTAEGVALDMVAQETAGSASSTAAEELPKEKQDKLFAMTERSIRIKTKGRYPAHTRVLQVMKAGLEQGLPEGLKQEAKAFAELSVGDVSRNLVFLFFATEFAKAGALSMARRSSAPLTTVGVFGGGLMGSTLAQMIAANDLRVLFRTANPSRQKEAMDKILEVAQRSETCSNVTEKLLSAQDDALLKEADIIVEACKEDLQTKKEVFQELVKLGKDDCVYATNTSSLSVAEIARDLPNKQNFLGLHFFHPVDRMQLVEVVVHPDTSREAQARAAALIAKLGKIPMFVKDSPTFLVNRLLYCYLSQAARLAANGVPMNWLEDAAIDFGMPMGPMALLDEVGLDVANRVAQTLCEAFGERMTPPEQLARALSIGMVGKKTGSGIYLWDATGKRGAFDPRITDDLKLKISDDKPDQATCQKLAEEMILPMVDEAARCLESKVVRRAREIDLCMIIGMGFPAFRGGLLHYADSLGIDRCIERLDEIFAAGAPTRFVSPYLLKMKEENKVFYPRSSSGED